MPTRIRFKETFDWTNPVKEVYPKPFLGEIIFPIDPSSPPAEEAREALRRVYCAKRRGGEKTFNALRAFIRNPDRQLLVIWGEVGIGKTWFVRYELTCRGVSKQYHTGVIDILSSGVYSSEDAIYIQLCPILESYFVRFFRSVKGAFLEYARFVVIQQIGENQPEDEISAGAADLVGQWLPADYSREYAERLLLALEYLNKPLLFLMIDNIDRAGEAEQTILLDIAKRILRNNRIRLIVPLRKSFSLLSDRFKGLKEQPYHEIELTPLRLDRMLELRFKFSEDGVDLSKSTAIVDRDLRITFPELYERIFKSESGRLILTIAGRSAREALLLTDRLIHSDHLRGLENISNNQYAIASLMLSDSTQIDPAFPYLINLFDNNEPRTPGNALIRFRILEYFHNEKAVDPNSMHFLQYMERLGYDETRLRRVLSLMVGTAMIFSQKGIVAEKLDELDIDELGTFEITDIGNAYLETLIRLQWYFVCVKRGVIIPEKYISYDKANDTEYITHADLYQFLKEEEDEERFRIRMWESKQGRLEGVHLESPSEIAKRALREGRDT